MNILENIVSLIVVLGILVTLHEFGHFWVARRCGVKVLRFSIGFGKPIYLRRGRSGTEFAVSWIPLGGYVKMLDEREAPVAEDDLPFAFNRKSVYQRIAIVAAGPIVNFLLAFVLYWALFIHGISAIVPVVGNVSPGSPAQAGGLKSGEEITQIEGRDTRSWQDVNLALVGLIGHSGILHVKTSDDELHSLPVSRYLVDQNPPEPLTTLGLAPWQPVIPARLSEVLENSPAAKAGLKSGDTILAVGNESITNWIQLVAIVRSSPDKSLQLKIRHSDGQEGTIFLVTESRGEGENKVGYLGAAAQETPFPDKYIRLIRYNPLLAVPAAARQTGEMTWLTLDSVGKMIVGLISPRNLSGPITIARVAGQSARSGLETFVSFLAYLSISLGVVNLLPVPVLDGGHILYFIVEAVRGRPLSDRVQMNGLKLGMALVGVVMLMAFYFDMMRL